MSSIIHSQAADIPANMTTTGFDVPKFRIVDNLGVVRGVVVRSRSVFGTVGAALQTMLGGNISLFTELAERTRKQAFDTMLVQAHRAGADAVIGIRYDANELMKGVTEVLCYGTAVRSSRWKTEKHRHAMSPLYEVADSECPAGQSYEATLHPGHQ